MTTENQPTLTFNGVDYLIADLSDEAKAQMGNVRQAEMEMQRLNTQLAMITTARNAYTQALTSALSKQDQPAAAKKPAEKKKPAAKKKAPAAKKAPAKKKASAAEA